MTLIIAKISILTVTHRSVEKIDKYFLT